MQEEISKMNFYKHTLFESLKDDAKMIAKATLFLPIMLTVVGACLIAHACVYVSEGIRDDV